MKPELEKIQDGLQESFTAKIVNRKNRPLLMQAWHYHPEIEICYTRTSTGNRYVGNKISPYAVGDLVMFGSLLPHGFTTKYPCEQIVIQLDRDFLGQGFFNKPEMRRINLLLAQSKMGLQFHGKSARKAVNAMNKILKKEGSSKLISLLKLLSILSETNERKQICSREYSMSVNINQLTRVKTVFDYIEHNYRKDISIKDAAELINLTESAFYKFIKKHTKKKFTQIINEFRINHASKLLIESEFTIKEICYQCGYNNLSYFNRKFRDILDVKPSDFRNKYK